MLKAKILITKAREQRGVGGGAPPWGVFNGIGHCGLQTSVRLPIFSFLSKVSCQNGVFESLGLNFGGPKPRF